MLQAEEKSAIFLHQRRLYAIWHLRVLVLYCLEFLMFLGMTPRQNQVLVQSNAHQHFLLLACYAKNLCVFTTGFPIAWLHLRVAIT